MSQPDPTLDLEQVPPGVVADDFPQTTASELPPEDEDMFDDPQKEVDEKIRIAIYFNNRLND